MHSTAQQHQTAHPCFLPLAVLCIRGAETAAAQLMQASNGAAAAMGKGRQPAPLAAAQLVMMRQEDIDRLHDDDEDGKSAAAQQRSERGDRPLLRRDRPLPLLLLLTPTSSVRLPLPVCWHREYESKTPAAAPELTVGLQRLIIAFVPRPAVSEALHHALGGCTGETSCRLARPLPAPPHHADCRVAVLYGTGGVGKTQLALAHARLPRSRTAPYRLRWWIAAEQRDGLQAQYREFAAGIPVDVNCAFSALVSAVNAWLSARPDWLVVFDNVPAFDDHLADIIPPTPLPTQHVLITTRHTEWPAAYRTVSVDVMDEAEALQLLKEGAGIAAADRRQDADIIALANELGYLPLALSHAAAYVKRRRVSFADYLSRYMETSLLDSRRDKKPTGDRYPHAVAQTWDMSIAAVEQEAEAEGVPALARALLTACSYLDPDAIPRSLLHRWLSSSGLLTGADDVQAVVDTLLASAKQLLAAALR